MFWFTSPRHRSNPLQPNPDCFRLVPPFSAFCVQGAEVVECACMIELKALNGVGKLHERHPDVPVWSLISEDILTVEGVSES